MTGQHLCRIVVVHQSAPDGAKKCCSIHSIAISSAVKKRYIFYPFNNKKITEWRPLLYPLTLVLFSRHSGWWCCCCFCRCCSSFDDVTSVIVPQHVGQVDRYDRLEKGKKKSRDRLSVPIRQTLQRLKAPNLDNQNRKNPGVCERPSNDPSAVR